MHVRRTAALAMVLCIILLVMFAGRRVAVPDVTSFVARLGNPAAAYFGATGVWRDNPHDLLAFNGKLWIASGDAASNNPPSAVQIPVHVYDPPTGLFSKQGIDGTAPNTSIATYQIEHFRVINLGSGDRIVIPTYQPKTHDYLSFFASDGNGTWSETTVNPGGTSNWPHTYDVYTFGSRLFASITHASNGSAQTLYGDDGAGSNTPSTTLGNTPGWRPTAFFELDGYLYSAVQAGYQGFPAFAGVDNLLLYRYNGSNAMAAETGTAYGAVFNGAASQSAWAVLMRPVNFPDTGTVFYLGANQPNWPSHDIMVPFGLFKATSLPPNTASVGAVSLPNGAVPDALLVDGSTLYCLGHYSAGGNTVASVMATTDGSSWSESFSFVPADVAGVDTYPQAVARSFALLNSAWYFGIGTLSTTSIPSSVGDILAYDASPSHTSVGASVSGAFTMSDLVITVAPA